MPVKVRCGDCGQGISAPDAARGKTLKCKGCGSPVRVPRGSADESEDRPRRKKRPAKKRPAKKRARRPEAQVDDDDFFSKLDLDRVEDADVRLCPKCAAEVDEDDLECPACGVNMETGVISERQKIKHSKGPDPDEYYTELWSNSWTFLKENWGVAVRLSLTWSIYMMLYWRALVGFVGTEKLPLQAFFAFLAAIAVFAGQGCFGQLLTAVVTATKEKQDRMDRFEFDFFQCISQGIKYTVWAYVLAMPFLWVTASVMGILMSTEVIDQEDSILVLKIIGIAAYVIPLWTFPTAISHMTAKYTYKAYLPTYMMTYTAKNIKAAMSWWLLTIAVMIPGIGGVVTALYFLPDLYTFLLDAIATVLGWMDFEPIPENRAWYEDLIAFPLFFLFLFIMNIALSLPLSFPSLMSMRACGLYAYYNARTLKTSERRTGGEPVGFWPRYLAYLVDILVIYSITTIVWGMAFGACRFFYYLDMGGWCFIFDGMFYLFALAFPILYFAMQESSSGRATLGMAGLGIIVVDDKGNSPIMRAAGFNRAICQLFFHILRDLPYLACYFNKNGKAPHDSISQTQVVWRHEFH